MNGNRHPHSIELERAEARLCSKSSCVLYGTEAAAVGSGCQCDPQAPRAPLPIANLVEVFTDEEMQEMFEHWLRNTTLPRALPRQ